MVDTGALLERVDLSALIKRDLGQPARREGRWLKWTCPFHADGKTPSLGIAGSRWKCFGCGKSGDAIDWLREREGLGFREACRQLGSADSVSIAGSEPLPPQNGTPPPSAAWQEQAQQVLKICRAKLWSDAGRKARVWLSERGLADKTVQSWHLGFNPHDQKVAGLWVPRGIVIPCLSAGQVWYLKVRRAAGQPKYSQISGGQLALFGAHTLPGRDMAVVTEGEFDAILLHQEAGDMAGIVTLGSASVRLPDAWAPWLLGVRRLLIAYDADAAGGEGAAAWRAVSRYAQRLVPLACKDVTDFYLAGGDLCAWVQFALSVDGEPTATPDETRALVSQAPWEGQRVSIKDLPNLQARYGLRVAGGDPDLEGKPWRPVLYLKENDS